MQSTQTILQGSGLDRRALLTGGLAAGAALAIPGILSNPQADLARIARTAAAPVPDRAAGPERRLALRCIHTGHGCDAVFMRGDSFDAQGLAELDQGMRDWRTGQAIEMDRDLLMLIAQIRDDLGVAARTPVSLISGYRSPQTNGALHARSNGVATKSQHMLGKAVDIAIPGVPLDRLRSAALAMKRGGVGYYPADGFVHVDTGAVRFW